MAIAESIRIGIFHRVVEHPTPMTPDLKIRKIVDFSRNEALDLARAYISNSLNLRNPFNQVEKSRLEGILEVQKKTLEMIGQHHIIRTDPLADMKNSRPISEVDLTRDMRPISMSDIKKLAVTYLESKSFVTNQKLEKKEWTQLLPEEMRMYARMDESGRILVALGQRDLIFDINRKFDSPSQHMDWTKMRSSGHGEIL